MAAVAAGGAGGAVRYSSEVRPLIDTDPAGCFLFQGTPSWNDPHKEIIEVGPTHHDFGYALLNLYSVASKRCTNPDEINTYAKTVIRNLIIHEKMKPLPSREKVMEAVGKRDNNHSPWHTRPIADELLKRARDAYGNDVYNYGHPLVNLVRFEIDNPTEGTDITRDAFKPLGGKVYNFGHPLLNLIQHKIDATAPESEFKEQAFALLDLLKKGKKELALPDMESIRDKFHERVGGSREAIEPPCGSEMEATHQKVIPDGHRPQDINGPATALFTRAKVLMELWKATGGSEASL